MNYIFLPLSSLFTSVVIVLCQIDIDIKDKGWKIVFKETPWWYWIGIFSVSIPGYVFLFKY
jgi:hypothetical protein